MKRTTIILPIVIMMLLAASWLRGRSRTDAVSITFHSGNVQIAALHHGGLLFAFSENSPHPADHSGLAVTSVQEHFVEDILRGYLRYSDNAQFLGFRYAHVSSISMERRVFFFPPWVFSVFAAVLLVLPLLRRPKPDHCQTCGYDLRATPDRCPECGTEIPKSVTIKSA